MVDIAKQWFSMGVTTADDLTYWVKAEAITKDDYKTITGQEYQA